MNDEKIGSFFLFAKEKLESGSEGRKLRYFFLSFFVVSCLCGLTNGQKKRSIEEVTVQLGGMIAQSFFIQNHFYLSRLS